MSSEKKFLAVDTIYRLRNIVADFAIGNPNLISVGGGTFDVYCSNSNTKPTGVSEMNVLLSGVSQFLFNAYPEWMLLTNASGTLDEIVLAGLDVDTE